MKNSIFSSVNLPSPEMAKVKTPSEVKKENQENPTTKEKRLNKMINTEQANFDTLILKPKTRHNKIQLLKSQITLFYLIEKMPKMNKSKVKKISEIVREIEDYKSLETLREIEELIYEIE